MPIDVWLRSGEVFMNDLSRLSMVVAILGTVLLTGCTTNPYTREQQASKAATGAAIGAAAGAAVGAITGGDRGERALIGAGAGALAGAGVGYYMDVQETRLRQRLEHTGVSVTRVGNEIILNMPGHITFETDHADINPRFYEVLNSVALVLMEYDKTSVNVAGHTDSTGSKAYNQRLSKKRATSVAQYLNSQGIANSRLVAIGFGETQPVANNTSETGRRLNRRVELTLSPVT
jgi:outer membrane protein OmpA-like peptidoglycan-associated protein